MRISTLDAARNVVELEYSVRTEPYGAEDRNDFRVFHNPDLETGSATLVSKATGQVREIFVPLNFDKLGRMARVGDWPI